MVLWNHISKCWQSPPFYNRQTANWHSTWYDSPNSCICNQDWVTSKPFSCAVSIIFSAPRIYIPKAGHWRIYPLTLTAPHLHLFLYSRRFCPKPCTIDANSTLQTYDCCRVNLAQVQLGWASIECSVRSVDLAKAQTQLLHSCKSISHFLRLVFSPFILTNLLQKH